MRIQYGLVLQDIMVDTLEYHMAELLPGPINLNIPQEPPPWFRYFFVQSSKVCIGLRKTLDDVEGLGGTNEEVELDLQVPLRRAAARTPSRSESDPHAWPLVCRKGGSKARRTSATSPKIYMDFF